ncbi:hypothetical protein VIGAN_11026600 [Vigna angularis var. angularis]|uniref:Uncharacterized protein n=1 Tax=Vigna angularis var. angularis TaxID=157739 RepID=A0A0S3T833_PHAAN|nr:hypothetical protein VIGAN_11026600 [Vigna angularis var. angularis]
MLSPNKIVTLYYISGGSHLYSKQLWSCKSVGPCAICTSTNSTFAFRSTPRELSTNWWPPHSIKHGLHTPKRIFLFNSKRLLAAERNGHGPCG